VSGVLFGNSHFIYFLSWEFPSHIFLHWEFPSYIFLPWEFPYYIFFVLGIPILYIFYLGNSHLTYFYLGNSHFIYFLSWEFSSHTFSIMRFLNPYLSHVPIVMLPWNIISYLYIFLSSCNLQSKSLIYVSNTKYDIRCLKIETPCEAKWCMIWVWRKRGWFKSGR